jgi:HlyD family secretion protein
MKIVKWILVVAVIVGVLFFARSLYLGDEPQATQVSPFYERMVTVERGDLEVLVSANGVVEPINRVEIKSKASGQIEQMTVEEGDVIRRGGLIARLDQSVARNELEQARADMMVSEANVTQSQNNLKRAEQLFERGLISAEEIDRVRVEEVRARSQLVRSKASLQLAEERMEETIVRSPIDGIMLTKDVEVGQIISSGVTTVGGGTLIATIADMDYVHVTANVDEVDIGRVRAGQKARIVADAYPNRSFTGEVIRVSPQGRTEQNITTFRVTALVPNEGRLLKAGMSADVELEIASKQNIVQVPNEALIDPAAFMQQGGDVAALAVSGNNSPRPVQGRPQRDASPEGSENIANSDRANMRIVMVKEGNEVKPRRVAVGISNFDYTEIVSGLEEGEEILIRTLSRARQAGLEWQQRIRGRGGFGGFGN